MIFKVDINLELVQCLEWSKNNSTSVFNVRVHFNLFKIQNILKDSYSRGGGVLNCVTDTKSDKTKIWMLPPMQILVNKNKALGNKCNF